MAGIPAILTDKVVGEQATQLYTDAQEMIQEIDSKTVVKAKSYFRTI